MRFAAILLAFASLLQAHPVVAGPLAEAYRAALANDPDYLSARAARDAASESAAQGLAGLLPLATAGYNTSQNTTDQTLTGTTGPVARISSYPSTSSFVQMKAPILKPRAWFAYSQGKAQAASGEWKLRSQLQDLGNRTLQAYADVVDARAGVELARAQVARAARRADAQRRLLEGGEVTQVQVRDSEARLALDQVALREADDTLANATRNFELSTGLSAAMVPGEAPLRDASHLSVPGSTKELLELASERNPDLLAQRETLEAAVQDVRKNLSDHSPTVDLVAAYSRSENGQDIAIGQKLTTTSIGIQIAVPLYTGGQTQSTVRQAIANREKAGMDLRSLQHRIELQARQSYHAFITARQRLNATEELLKSAELQRTAAERGIPAGVATEVELVDAQYQIANARRERTKARLSLMQSYARIKAMIGELNEKAISAIEGF